MPRTGGLKEMLGLGLISVSATLGIAYITFGSRGAAKARFSGGGKGREASGRLRHPGDG